MNTIIIAKMACDDSMLKASSKFGAEEVQDVVDAAFAFTPFKVLQTELICGRVSEKYYLACKRLGYHDSFFSDYTILALCRLSPCGNSEFESVYVPFSGEVFLIPKGCFELASITDKSHDIILSNSSESGKVLKRRFDICMDRKEKEEMFWNKLRAKTVGHEVIHDPEDKRIFSLTAREDFIANGEAQEESFPPMHFLYNEFVG